MKNKHNWLFDGNSVGIDFPFTFNFNDNLNNERFYRHQGETIDFHLERRGVGLLV